MEVEILKSVIKGNSVKKTAKELGLDENHVRRELSKIKKELGVNSNIKAGIKAIMLGLI